VEVLVHDGEESELDSRKVVVKVKKPLFTQGEWGEGGGGD